MIKQFLMQYKIFKDTGFSTRDSISFTYNGMMIDFYFTRQKLKRKLKKFFR